MTVSYDNDSDTDSTSSSTASEEEFSSYPRPTTDWQHHRPLIESHGFFLDTVTDVKQFYDRYWEGAPLVEKLRCAEYTRACGYEDGSALCGDPGLVGIFVFTIFGVNSQHTFSLITCSGVEGQAMAKGLS